EEQDFCVRNARAMLWRDPDSAQYRMADWLQRWHEARVDSAINTSEHGVLVDILGWALAIVDWQDVAETYITMAREEMEREQDYQRCGTGPYHHRPVPSNGSMGAYSSRQERIGP